MRSAPPGNADTQFQPSGHSDVAAHSRLHKRAPVAVRTHSSLVHSAAPYVTHGSPTVRSTTPVSSTGLGRHSRTTPPTASAAGGMSVFWLVSWEQPTTRMPMDRRAQRHSRAVTCSISHAQRRRFVIALPLLTTVRTQPRRSPMRHLGRPRPVDLPELPLSGTRLPGRAAEDEQARHRTCLAVLSSPRNPVARSVISGACGAHALKDAISARPAAVMDGRARMTSGTCVRPRTWRHPHGRSAHFLGGSASSAAPMAVSVPAAGGSARTGVTLKFSPTSRS